MKLARSLSLLSLAVGLVTGLAACGGNTDDDSGGSAGSASGPKVEEIPGLLAAAYCPSVAACLGPISDFYLNGEDCQTRLTKQLTNGEFGKIPELVAAGKLSYDGSKVQACIDAFKNGGCAQLISRSPSACDAVFNGKGKAGDECTVGAECGTGLFCQAGTACPGKCAARGGSGTACTADDACESGLTCQNKKCTKPSAANGACGGGGTNPDCEPGLTCVGDDDKTMKAGACQSNSSVFTAPNGGACDFINDTLCAAGSFCSLESLMPAPTFKCIGKLASGAACKVAIPDACPSGEYCNVDLAANKFDGTCTKIPSAGEACGKGIRGETCASYAVCVSGTCKALQETGAACGDPKECWSEVCKSGKCSQGLACEPDQTP